MMIFDLKFFPYSEVFQYDFTTNVEQFEDGAKETSCLASDYLYITSRLHPPLRAPEK